MANKYKNIETAEEVVAAPKIMAAPAPEENDVSIAEGTKGFSIADLVERFSYQGIVRNTPYLIFLALLCVVYITNNNRAISLNRSINKKEKELKEIRWSYLDIQSRLMLASSETQLIERAQTIGLKPLEKPPYEVKIAVQPKEK